MLSTASGQAASRVEGVADRVAELAEKYGLYGQAYTAKGGRAGGFQQALLGEYHKAFDEMGAAAADGQLAGECIHCLHDFKQWTVDEAHDMYDINFKGLFTRDRMPKVMAQ